MRQREATMAGKSVVVALSMVLVGCGGGVSEAEIAEQRRVYEQQLHERELARGQAKFDRHLAEMSNGGAQQSDPDKAKARREQIKSGAKLMCDALPGQC